MAQDTISRLRNSMTTAQTRTCPPLTAEYEQAVQSTFTKIKPSMEDDADESDYQRMLNLIRWWIFDINQLSDQERQSLIPLMPEEAVKPSVDQWFKSERERLIVRARNAYMRLCEKNGWVYQQPGEESSVDGDFITLRNCHGDLAEYKHYPFSDRLSLYRIGEAAANS